MTNAELKAAAIDKLLSQGDYVPHDAHMRVVCQHIQRVTGRRMTIGMRDYIYLYAGPRSTPMTTPDAPTFRELKLDPILAYNFERADLHQKPFMTPRGAIGNGDERSPVWRR